MLTEDRITWRHLLNQREQVKTLDAEYEKRFWRKAVQDPDLVYFLGDNAKFTKAWSATSRAIPTFRTAGGKHWFRRQGRWLVTADKLACLGFPVTEETAACMGVRQLLSSDPVRDGPKGAKFTGNAMHFMNASIILLVALCCFSPACENPSIDWEVGRPQSGKRRRLS